MVTGATRRPVNRLPILRYGAGVGVGVGEYAGKDSSSTEEEDLRLKDGNVTVELRASIDGMGPTL